MCYCIYYHQSDFTICKIGILTILPVVETPTDTQLFSCVLISKCIVPFPVSRHITADLHVDLTLSQFDGFRRQLNEVPHLVKSSFKLCRGESKHGSEHIQLLPHILSQYYSLTACCSHSMYGCTNHQCNGLVCLRQ